ncbi:Starch-binding associating with outer membrane [Chitinophaga costaii]|uniref:Starch-binding associating with outer membrane n=1 Tax=Chitinophaga costaii TaxID=1335309 RepID=A0A1C4ATT2_9BACT|nr:RagB/SusD family nutrient uptake outer membrane protein [Chitinophaga costaii]PUZ26742.1 RagB/SusD family nutrient uptake outer membrane protein [Chitinophaga costaii]SCB98062.1 Starch-binding associating with outer membrane [Chitinophaga costaii]
MKKIIPLIFLISLGFSCNKQVLNKKPLDIISDADVFKDPALINAYLTQIYYDIPVFGNDCNASGPTDGDGGWHAFDINDVSDESFPQFRDWNPSNAFSFKYGNLNINGGLLDWWGYNTVREINQFLEKLPTSPLPEDEVKSKLAEARFLRAFCYFSMVKRYGGIPLITKVQNANDPDSTLFPARETEQHVYDFILSEIDAIADDLPEVVNGDNIGRPSKYAALALKSRAALYAASIAQFGNVQLNGVVGIPASLANSYYQASYNASQAIIKSNKYSLYTGDADKVTNFRNIFLVKNNSEVIFAKRHDNVNQATGGNGWGVDFFNCPRPQAWGRGLYEQAYLEFAESFEHVDGTPGTLDRAAIQSKLLTTDELWANKDPRFYATFYTQNTSWKGGTLDFHAGIRLPDGTIKTDGAYNGIAATGNQDYQGTGIGILKYLDESHDNMAGSNSGWATSQQDWLIFRYAEILLNNAEAAFELGNKDDALHSINQIRDRAGIAPLTDITRDKIHHERKVELAFEGQRYWDVRRWRTAVNDLSVRWSGIRYILDATTGKYQIQIINNVDGSSNIPQFRQENYYLPLTLQRTSNNPKLLENPGY